MWYHTILLCIEEVYKQQLRSWQEKKVIFFQIKNKQNITHLSSISKMRPRTYSVVNRGDLKNCSRNSLKEYINVVNRRLTKKYICSTTSTFKSRFAKINIWEQESSVVVGNRNHYRLGKTSTPIFLPEETVHVGSNFLF